MDWTPYKTLFKQILPGLESQQKMSPSHRKILHSDETRYFKQSAVLLLLYPSNETTVHSNLSCPNIVLIERPKDASTHSGQLCFPGGKKEEKDLELEHTALRETQEEIGVSPTDIHMLGALTPLYIPVSEYQVHPFVAYCKEPPHFHCNSSEVSSLIECPLSSFQEQTRKIYIENQGNNRIEIPYFAIEGKKLWGASAMILNEFLDLIQLAKINNNKR